MLSRDMYTDEYIQSLYERTGNDPALLERVIYASVSREERPLCSFWNIRDGSVPILILS